MVVGVDRSLRMMAQAKAAVVQYGTRVALIHEDAEALSFRGEAFDLVTCLEALEFMWDPAAVLREMVRVLRPGGVLLVSGRVGRDARFFPGRLCPPGRVVACLHELGMDAITTERWQVHYDLIWARKPLGSP
jgi:ubiquinone/menaquinone biosynthesis C-methylase UbiE